MQANLVAAAADAATQSLDDARPVDDIDLVGDDVTVGKLLAQLFRQQNRSRLIVTKSLVHGNIIIIIIIIIIQMYHDIMSRIQRASEKTSLGRVALELNYQYTARTSFATRSQG
jgi:hypothetical protein